MVESELSYEQIRFKRVEENKKRMMELHLNDLAHSLLLKPSSGMQAKPRTQRTPVEFSEVRRSSRAKNPPPSYKEIELESPEKTKRLPCQRKDLQNRVYASKEARENATKRAGELQSSLQPHLSSFVKKMTQSHVTGGFWLGLPHDFCLLHLPHRNEKIILVDESDAESATKYLVKQNGLSAGWRGFSIDHGLVDGDALVFQRLDTTKFKVYIVRAYDQANRDSGRIGKENDVEINKKQEENVSEASSKLQGSGKRKKGGSRV